jgi:hypothetical protein
VTIDDIDLNTLETGHAYCTQGSIGEINGNIVAGGKTCRTANMVVMFMGDEQCIDAVGLHAQTGQSAHGFHDAKTAVQQYAGGAGLDH